MLAKWYSGTLWPKVSCHLSYKWGKTLKNLTQGTCPDRRSNPGPLHDRRACYRLLHSGEQIIHTQSHNTSMRRIRRDIQINGDLDTPTCWAIRCKVYWGICSKWKPLSSNLSSVNTGLFIWGFLFCTEPVSLFIFTSRPYIYRCLIRQKENREIDDETFGDTFSTKIFSWKYCGKSALLCAVTHEWKLLRLVHNNPGTGTRTRTRTGRMLK